MVANDATYTRLPGRARKGFGLLNATSQRLWWKPDHLLVVSSLYFTERYKRFYFQDIQAVTLTRTSAGMVLNIVLAVLSVLFGLWALLSYTSLGWDIVATAFLALSAMVWLLVLALNALLGPTCRCLLYTAVHCDELFCLGRLRTAQRVLQFLRGHIEAAQGGALSGEALDVVAGQQESGDALEISQMSARSTPLGGQRLLRHDSGTVHATLFYLLFVDAVLSGIQLVAPVLIPGPVSLLFILTLMGFTVAALVRQRGTTLPQRVRSVTWATLGYLCLIILSVYVYVIINEVGLSMSDEMPESFATVQATLNKIVNSLSILFDILLGGTGIQYLNEYRRRGQAEPVPSSDSPADPMDRE